MRPRPLTDDDRRAWDDFASPAPPRRTTSSTAPVAPPAVLPAVEVKAPRGVQHALSIGVSPPGLDRNVWKKLVSGRIIPDYRLDLHGMTATAAHAALHQTLRSATTSRCRCIEVITGRGRSPAGGVLRRELPLWLNLPGVAPMILAAAHPSRVNQGSVLLLLRRPRKPSRARHP